ncbi:hypothetical protein AB6D33_25500 [Vibrio splendidus]
MSETRNRKKVLSGGRHLLPSAVSLRTVRPTSFLLSMPFGHSV